MKHYYSGGMILLLGLASCGSAVSTSQSPVAAEPSQSVPSQSVSSQSVAASTVISPAAAPPPTLAPSLATSPIASPSSTPLSGTVPVSQNLPASSTPNTIQRDFAPTAPLPATGQVTVRGSIRDVESDRMITPCPSDSAPYAFAESTHYLVQICSAEYDPWLPKYYMSRAKDGSGNLELTNNDPNTARQLIFTNNNYTYTLYRDNARPDPTNAYLEVHMPDGKTYAEALLYFYEQVDRPTP